jgi:hypothetical protein
MRFFHAGPGRTPAVCRQQVARRDSGRSLDHRPEFGRHAVDPARLHVARNGQGLLAPRFCTELWSVFALLGAWCRRTAAHLVA